MTQPGQRTGHAARELGASPLPASQPEPEVGVQVAADRDGPAGERLAFSIDEAAQLTGLSRDLLYDQMRVGKLSYLKVGRRRIITRQQLDAFLRDGAA